jgi:hypothetical protein
MKCGLYFVKEYEFNYKDLGKFFFKKQAPKDVHTDQLSKTVYVSSNFEPRGEEEAAYREI